MGSHITTDGDADSDSTVRIFNGSGQNLRIVNDSAAGVVVLSPGSPHTSVFSATGRTGTELISFDGNAQRAMFLTCGASANTDFRLTCWADLSPAL